MNPKSEKNETARSSTSHDLESTRPVTPVKPAESSRVPKTKRQRKFQRQVEMAKAGIVSGKIEPKARDIAEHVSCALRTALSILAVLTQQGVIERSGRGWKLADRAAKHYQLSPANRP